MATPITGPVLQQVVEQDTYLSRQRYRQRRPYDLVLAYQVRAARLLRRGKYSTGSDAQPNIFAQVAATTDPVSSFDDTTRINQAKSLAYARLLGKISDRANWGENIGQFRESTKLLEDSFKKLAGAVRAVRKRDPAAFGRWMVGDKKSAGKGHWFNPFREVANASLQWNFAIAPTISDIYSAMSFLQEPIKDVRVRGRAHVEKACSYDPGGFGNRWATESGKVLAEYGALVKVSNPNLWLVNTMGVLNPVQTAWQLLPGSFLFDWLANVEQTLGMMTDFCGLEVVSSYSTYAVKSVRLEGITPGFYKGQTALFSRLDMVRTPGISLPSLRFRPLKIPGMRRAGNAAALAIQAFGPGKRSGSLVPGVGGG